MDTEYLVVIENKLMSDPPIYHWYRINKETGEIGPIATYGNRIDTGRPVYPNGEPCSECMWKRNRK